MSPHANVESEPEADEIRIDESMTVLSTDHETLGQVRTILVDEDTEEAQFLVLARAQDGATVLMPVEIIQAGANDSIVADATRETMLALPEYDPALPPTRQQIERACEAVGVEVAFEEV